MAKNIERIAKLLGAKVVAEVPDVGGGAFGAARLAGITANLRARTPSVESDVGHKGLSGQESVDPPADGSGSNGAN